MCHSAAILQVQFPCPEMLVVDSDRAPPPQHTAIQEMRESVSNKLVRVVLRFSAVTGGTSDSPLAASTAPVGCVCQPFASQNRADTV